MHIKRGFLRASVFLVFTIPAHADYKEAIRYTELVEALTLRNLPLPDGSGVRVTHVEASTSGSNPSFYLPVDPEFSGKTITDQTGGGVQSGHASRVGRNLYGNTTSIAPGITDVDVYFAGDWLNNEGWFFGDVVPTDSNHLQNHSWISNPDSDATKLMDYAVFQDGFLPVIGLNNGSGSTVPGIYGSIYNGISVGRSDGGHSRGGTLYDTAGRTKPEIVAPDSFTSFATPYVTASAAVLIDAASTPAAADQLSLKAILLAGADKSISGSWDQTPLRPIDEVFGAGELDIFESYFIQNAGQQNANTTIGQRGWSLENLGAAGSHTYTLIVPSGFELRDLSAIVTWNREVVSYVNTPILSDPPGPPQVLGYENVFAINYADLSLKLRNETSLTDIYTSDSNVDNIEHIWRNTANALDSATYSLTVTTDIPVEYAIAWRSQLYQDYTMWAAENIIVSPETAPNDDPDKDGIKNLLEHAFGGNPEVSSTDILPTHAIIEENGNQFIEITFRKPTFANDLIYTVETSTEIGGIWSSAPADVIPVKIEAIEGSDFELHTYRRLEPVTSSSRAFLRVSVSQ